MKNLCAFPSVEEVSSVGGIIVLKSWQSGMSLRDYFAGQAIVGLLSSKKRCWNTMSCRRILSDS